jgi:two-component system cell cycle response regulator
MTALILVVDDLEPNVKLLEAKLAAEYYDVVTANDGFGAIAQAKKHLPDLILLDVMMPGMDGFEACRQIKAAPETSHIPIVMVTALSEPSDRIQGLLAGADDFLTKPINDVQLLARVRSLVRMKQLIDELRLRGQTSADIGEVTGVSFAELSDVSGSHVLLVDDDVVQTKNIAARLAQEKLHTTITEDIDGLLNIAKTQNFDLVMVSTQLSHSDGLRLCSHLRSADHTRHLPQIILVEEDDKKTLVKGLEMGVNDYMICPIDMNEMACRVRTNIRRKKYQDALKASYQKTVNMAIKDNLTGLYNRHYLNAHLHNLASSSLERSRPLCCLMLDMDHFKQVNDTYGHDVGDEVLVQLAERIVGQLRSSDLVARFGGEEFVVLLPGCELVIAQDVAERMRQSIEKEPFKVSHSIGQINKTLSIGLSFLGPDSKGSSPTQLVEQMLKQADEALYASKHGGRNLVTVYQEGLNAAPASKAIPAPATIPTFTPVSVPAVEPKSLTLALPPSPHIEPQKIDPPTIESVTTLPETPWVPFATTPSASDLASPPLVSPQSSPPLPSLEAPPPTSPFGNPSAQPSEPSNPFAMPLALAQPVPEAPAIPAEPVATPPAMSTPAFLSPPVEEPTSPFGSLSAQPPETSNPFAMPLTLAQPLPEAPAISCQHLPSCPLL